MTCKKTLMKEAMSKHVFHDFTWAEVCQSGHFQGMILCR